MMPWQSTSTSCVGSMLLVACSYAIVDEFQFLAAPRAHACTQPACRHVDWYRLVADVIVGRQMSDACATFDQESRSSIPVSPTEPAPVCNASAPRHPGTHMRLQKSQRWSWLLVVAGRGCWSWLLVVAGRGCWSWLWLRLRQG